MHFSCYHSSYCHNGEAETELVYDERHQPVAFSDNLCALVPTAHAVAMLVTDYIFVHFNVRLSTIRMR